MLYADYSVFYALYHHLLKIEWMRNCQGVDAGLNDGVIKLFWQVLLLPVCKFYDRYFWHFFVVKRCNELKSTCLGDWCGFWETLRDWIAMKQIMNHLPWEDLMRSRSTSLKIFFYKLFFKFFWSSNLKQNSFGIKC